MIELNETKMHPVRAAIFEFWWCVSIKYIFPWAMWWLLVMQLQSDTLIEPYGKYHWGWQVVGAMIPLMGIIVLIIPIFTNWGKKSTGEFADGFKADNSPAAKVAQEPAETAEQRGQVQMAELEPDQK